MQCGSHNSIVSVFQMTRASVYPFLDKLNIIITEVPTPQETSESCHFNTCQASSETFQNQAGVESWVERFCLSGF